MPTITFDQARKFGIPKKSLQTIEIPLTYSLIQSIDWLTKNGYKHNTMRKTKNFRRFRQERDIAGATYYSKKLPNGIVLVWQNYR